MVEGGEDPRFICRRMIIFASEDVGMADSGALPMAVAAAQANEHVGLPESLLNMAHAVVYLSTAPKSRASTEAISKAMEDVRQRSYNVPEHLADSDKERQRQLAREGKGYRKPKPGEPDDQTYRPSELEGRRYYEPD
jgi:putative ATPase